MTRKEMNSSWMPLAWRSSSLVQSVTELVTIGPLSVALIFRGPSGCVGMLSWSTKLPAAPELIRARGIETDPECLIRAFIVNVLLGDVGVCSALQDALGQ